MLKAGLSLGAVLRTLILVACVMGGGTEAVAKSKAKARAGAKHTPKKNSLRAKRAKPVPAKARREAASSALPVFDRSPRHVREFASGFGLLALSLPAVGFSAQARFLSNRKRPLYWGVDGQFALFAPGYNLTLLPAAWYDFVVSTDPVANLTFGVLAGPAFSRHVPNVPDESLALFGEVSIAFEIDDLSSVRGQFRPGIVGGRLAFAMTVLIGFRFR